MKAMLLTRAAPLLITTILVAAPAWAQSNSSQTSPSGTTTPAMTSTGNATPTAPQTTTSSQTSNTPSGTVHKATPYLQPCRVCPSAAR